MHIAWLGKKSPFCGNVTYSREVTNALLDRGYQVSFLHFAQSESSNGNTKSRYTYDRSPDSQLPKTASYNGNGRSHREKKEVPGWPDWMVEVSLPCLYKSTIYTIPTLKSSQVLARSLWQLQPDLVHASLTLSPLDFLLPEICQELSLPLVATFHPPFGPNMLNLTSGTQYLTYQLYAPCLANYDCVIVFSEIQRTLLVRLGVPAEKVAVIPNGVDEQKYSPGPADVKHSISASRLFVYQGRIAAEKNVESLLKAWKLSNMPDECKLLIIGNGPLAASLKLAYGPEHGIIWLGFIGDEQRRIEILRGADVFILPSFVEGLSLSLLEAMACGLACIATDAGADGEVLEGGAGVILNTNRVTSELRTLLPLFRDHPELTMLLGQKARRRVLERYTLTRNISQVEKLYAQILQQQQLQLTGT
ncbi:MAG: glycosyltransferase family 4 protein [Hormoscilla sp.]